LRFSAYLCQPASENEEFTDGVMHIPGMDAAAYCINGECILPEEHKNLTIGVDLIAKPKNLFPDELTSGIDEQSSFNIFNEFWKKRCDISPVRGSLSVWGLSVDDIGVASSHATSTVANDKNESEVMNKQFRHLCRTPGNVVPIVCKKWLTGHPKGLAAVYMLNGVIQSLRTGIIPGNCNADNIDRELKHCEYALYLSEIVKTPGIKAAMLTSFGFDQVGGELLIVHPDHVLATLCQEQLNEYNEKLARHNVLAYRYWQDALVGNHPFIQTKDHPPFTSEEEQVYMDPTARVHFNSTTGEYEF
ncbi:fatty acid synthase alpha subunit Lsd1, partial [Coemansia sp. RSA 1933]